MKYVVRERMFSIGDDFWIEDEEGRHAFLVDGKAMRLRETFELKDPEGRVLATVRKKLLAMRDTLEVERDGAVVASVRKAWFSPLREKYAVELDEGREMEVAGDLLAREFEMRVDGRTIGVVSRTWFHLRDTYGVEVTDDADAPLVLAVAVCVDRLLEGEEDED
ncbi:MAG: LURP-one-related/scramblase family protein [Nocardioidaceae bacterium]